MGVWQVNKAMVPKSGGLMRYKNKKSPFWGDFKRVPDLQGPYCIAY